MKVNGKTVKSPFKLRGTFSRIINGEDVETVAKVVNANADILEQAIKKIEELELEIENIRSCNSGKNL